MLETIITAVARLFRRTDERALAQVEYELLRAKLRARATRPSMHRGF